MLNKKYILHICLAGILINSSALEANPETNFYLKAQYNGEFFDNIGELKSSSFCHNQAFGATESSPISIPNKLKFVKPYNPEYKSSYFTGSIAAGNYLSTSTSIELELVYSKTEIDENRYLNSMAAHWLSLAKKKEYSIAINQSVRFENNGFKNIAGMINGYYNFQNEKLTPYVGGGIGISLVKFLDTTKLAATYQIKAGLSYAIAQNISIFTGYRYFGLFSDMFSDCKPLNAGALTFMRRAIPNKVDINNRFGVHGLELGLIFKI